MTQDDEYVVCPYCGEQHGDAWEWCKPDTPERRECQECGREFEYWAEVSVDYCTAPVRSDGEAKERDGDG